MKDKISGLFFIVEMEQPYMQEHSTVEKPQVEEIVFSSCLMLMSVGQGQGSKPGLENRMYLDWKRGCTCWLTSKSQRNHGGWDPTIYTVLWSKVVPNDDGSFSFSGAIKIFCGGTWVSVLRTVWWISLCYDNCSHQLGPTMSAPDEHSETYNSYIVGPLLGFLIWLVLY